MEKELYSDYIKSAKKEMRDFRNNALKMTEAFRDEYLNDQRKDEVTIDLLDEDLYVDACVEDLTETIHVGSVTLTKGEPIKVSDIVYGNDDEFNLEVGTDIVGGDVVELLDAILRVTCGKD